MRTRLCLLAIGVPALITTPAAADLIRFTFSGTLTAVNGPGTPAPEIEVGAPFTVSYIFDTLTADTDAAPNFGFYDGAVLTTSADVNTLLISATGGYISVLNNGFVGDTLFYESLNSTYRIQASLTDRQRGALESDDLPDDLDFGQWESNSFFLTNLDELNQWTAIGTITSFQRELVGQPCPADWDDSGAVNSSDISAFLTSWLDSVTSGNLNADFNGDLTVNSSDISSFLAQWLTDINSGTCL